MERQQIEFIAHKSIVRMVPTLDAYKFKPNGSAQWLQHLAWRFLAWCGALDQVYERNIEVVRHQIDADNFIRRLLQQKRSLFDVFRKEGQRLLIGSEDYAELMGAPEVSMQHFDFPARVDFDRRIVGLTVEVIPWMRGAVVMPNDRSRNQPQVSA